MLRIVYAECLNLARYAECRYTKKQPAMNKRPSLFCLRMGLTPVAKQRQLFLQHLSQYNTVQAQHSDA
jgi:hypothetical protein